MGEEAEEEEEEEEVEGMVALVGVVVEEGLEVVAEVALVVGAEVLRPATPCLSL